MSARQAIPLYLQLALFKTNSIPLAWQMAQAGTLPLNDTVKMQMEALLQQVNSIPDFGEILEKTALERLEDLSAGIDRFVKAPFEREKLCTVSVWQSGASELLYYAPSENPRATVLLVPSLINRSYIFDLSSKNSLARFLQTQGIATYLLNWGDPAVAEIQMDVDDYVIEKLIPAIRYITGMQPEPLSLVGYCMGGMLALAAAQLLPENIKQLALFSTPWDFHASDVMRLPNSDSYKGFLEGLFSRRAEVSGQLVHQLLYMLDPWSVHEKYRRFVKMKEGSPQFSSFIEREHWLHDDVSLTPKVANTAFVSWALENTTMHTKWQVGGTVIQPKLLKQPCFVAYGLYDRLVPEGCIKPLIAALQQKEVHAVKTGHIGLVVGSKARAHVWNPLAKWLLRR